jgi:CspA family cold shock protein
MSYSRGPRVGAGGDDAQRLTATVKWFNRTKGFGFLTATDGSGDVFLPASVLGHAGYDEVGEGTTIVCDVIEGPKGRAVAAILTVDASTATPHAPRGAGGFDRGPVGPTEELDGTVKWFDDTRGFGFVSPSDGGKDVFVHVSALRRSGMQSLVTGQTVKMQVQEARRGREATSIEII